MNLKLKLPFKLSGSIKTTPEQAKKMFNFNMKPDATGITFVNLPSGKTLIKNKMPHTPILTQHQKNKQIIFSIIGKIASRHLHDIIHPIWNPTPNASNSTNLSGQNLFIQTNMKILLPKAKEKKTHKKNINLATCTQWHYLTISTGQLNKPIIKTAEYYFLSKRFKFIIINPNKYMIGIAILDTKTFNLSHIPPAHYNTPIHIDLHDHPSSLIPHPSSLSFYHPIIYVYFKENKENANYSLSTPVIPKLLY